MTLIANLFHAAMWTAGAVAVGLAARALVGVRRMRAGAAAPEFGEAHDVDTWVHELTIVPKPWVTKVWNGMDARQLAAHLYEQALAGAL